MAKPHLQEERKLSNSGYQVIVGVDEVGRGAFAGPVVAGACVIFNSQFPISKSIRWEKLGIDDSKRLSAKKREELAKIIKKHARWGIGEASVTYINGHGIVKATEKAMRVAINSLLTSYREDLKSVFVLLDAFHIKYLRLKAISGVSSQASLIKGDQKSVSIAAASIIAKVHRDKLMIRLSSDFRKYRWNENKGYGTIKHREAIEKYGVTRHHRKGFLD